MPRYIFKIKEYYGEWSTIVDAPVSYLMPLETFKSWYKAEFGNQGMETLPERLERVEKTGCSGVGRSLKDLLAYNRAGKNETRIKTQKELLKKYKLI